jgi:Putative Ig domain
MISNWFRRRMHGAAGASFLIWSLLLACGFGAMPAMAQNTCSGQWTFSPATVTLDSSNQWKAAVFVTPPAGCTGAWYPQGANGGGGAGNCYVSAGTLKGQWLSGANSISVGGYPYPPTSPCVGTVDIINPADTVLASFPATDVAAPPLALACPSPTGEVGVLYSSPLVASGGVPPYAYSIPGGYIDGIFQGPGLLSGTPSAAGTFSFNVTVRDSYGKSGTFPCSITINGGKITLACPAANGLVGVLYSSALTASGGFPPYTFSISQGSLPAGLALNAGNGAITGRPTAAGTSSFTAQVADQKGGSTTVPCGIDDAKITMDSLEVTLPATPNAVDKTVPPGVMARTSTNTSAAFASEGSEDLVVVLLNSGTVTVNGVNVQPAASANQVQWQMDRDPTDKVDLNGKQDCSGAPKGAPAVAGSPGARVTFPPDNPGNFRLVAYIDANGNGKFDDGEQLRILRIAVVRVTLMNPTTSTFNVVSVFVPDAPSGVPPKEGLDVKGPGGGPAMKILGDFMIEGGGDTCQIGVNVITIGNVGNLDSDNFQVLYPRRSLGPATATETPAGPFPMVDTTRVTKAPGCPNPQPAGGTCPFRGRSVQTALQSATGQRARLESEDSPGFGNWKIIHPATGNPWGSTSGGDAFNEFVVAFSSDFPKTYSSLNENSYKLIVTGINDGTGKWKDKGSSSTSTNNETTLGPVKDKVQVLGLSFAYNYTFVCDPAPAAPVKCN